MKTVSIKTIHDFLPQDSIHLGEDFLITNFDKTPFTGHPEPIRFEGYLTVFIYEGHATAEVEMNEYDLYPKSLLVIPPGDILYMKPDDSAGPCKFILIAASKSWIYRSSINFSKLFYYGVSIMKIPLIQMTDQEMEMISLYRDLIMNIYSSNRPYMKENLNFIFSSLLCEIAACWETRMEESRSTAREMNASITLFSHFMLLASQMHEKERSIQFYANKMNISPQHLTRVVRQCSGKTPMEQIDNMLIMDCKNMLRFTNMSMKEIAARLNFSNQTVFSRLFKRYTGMLPSQFRAIQTNLPVHG